MVKTGATSMDAKAEGQVRVRSNPERKAGMERLVFEGFTLEHGETKAISAETWEQVKDSKDASGRPYLVKA